MAEAAKKSTGGASLLSKMASKTKTTSKSKTPIVTGEEVKTDEMVTILEEIKNLETELEAKKADFKIRVFEEYSKVKGAQGSFKFADSNGKFLLVSYKDQFSKIPIEHADFLREKLGAKFDEYFLEKRDIRIIDPTDKTIEFLVDKLGEEVFQDYFEVKGIDIVAKTGMSYRQFDIEDEEVRSLLNQYAPSFKVTKS